jgi:hypothetical protein
LERVPENVDAAKELLQYGLKGTDLEALVAIGKGVDDGRLVLKVCTHCKGDMEKAEAATLGQADVEHTVEAVAVDCYYLPFPLNIFVGNGLKLRHTWSSQAN